jgi:hypothetical protein
VARVAGGETGSDHPLCLSGCLGRGNTRKSLLRKRILGLWRSLVAHLTGGQGVAGSNPVSPTEGQTRDRIPGLFDARGISQVLMGSSKFRLIFAGCPAPCWPSTKF